jgi:endoglucanase
MQRRTFISLAAAGTAGLVTASLARAQQAPVNTIKQPSIPRWRGFNLTEMTGGHRNRRFVKRDFEWMKAWGFDFARLPLNYWCWSKVNKWLKIDENAFKPVDEAIAWGKEFGIHINLNLHRIPGYCVNGRDKEPFQLFDSPRESMQKALEAACLHWATLAKRYKGIPSTELSFDLFNEPPFMADQSRYVEVAKALISTIREIDPQRLIVADGADIGQTPVMGLVDQGVVQSTRGYQPKMVSHYKATWVPQNEFESFEPPVWPMIDSKGQLWNREKLRRS